MFNHRVAVYVPTTDLAHVNIVEENLTMWFGGSTTIPAHGTYYSEVQKRVIRDTILIVYAYTDEDGFNQYHPKVCELAKRLAKTLNQESVAVEFDSSLELIEG